MKNVILCPSVSRDIDLELTKRAAEILESRGIRAVVCPLFDGEATPLPEGFEYSEIEDEISTADMAVSFGGDGTILRVARAVADKCIPILAVNMGAMGFMAELEPEDIERINDVIDGKCRVRRRIMLDVELVRNGETILTDFALNDIVIKGYTKIIDIEVFGDDHAITHFAGDGAVIATPTGSTAYSMSAGGPIVEPDASNIIVTPISPHALAAKAFVLAPERKVRVIFGDKKENPAYIAVDGREVASLDGTDEIRIDISKRETRLIQLSNKSFYRKVYEKLGDR